ncbi:mechanosensitive ion channel-like protein [Fluviicoccus keumensis]|uniref:Small-conductance mechanosensitive channel n=1 Tax=Fluviicoccus keumensis TaxID=1435465 RepID=A0A4Q7Z4E8_9GAMM|nr:mechanosensitive ion channel family protein [Fluviicoccus keumensis]RZU45177.1 mechanosensitive ion channel-like protein [Fluviicoccus keumensis]
MAVKETFLDRLINLPVSDRTEGFIIGGILLVLGYLLAWLATSAFVRTMRFRLTAHQLLVWRRGIFYFLFLLFAISALHEMGFRISVLLGAAGVFTVAIGFASQTSASNLISGLFLIGEGSFSVGDTIQVGATQGEVMSIDLLSVKLRTPDNVFVRIPNESLIKSELRNLTRFAIRRIPITIGVAYREDIGKVRGVLLALADRHPLVLDEPAPQVTMQAFAPSSVDLQFTVWTRKETYSDVRDSMQEAIKRAFDEQGIEIPFPQISINSGEMNALPVVLQESGNRKTT